MHVHTVAVVTHQWLGHKGRRQAMGMGHIVNTVLVDLRLVRLGHQGVKTHTDLTLTGGAHLVVVYFHCQAHVCHGQTHT